MRMSYLVQRDSGFFIHHRLPGSGQLPILPQICRTQKSYYLGHVQNLGIFFEKLHK